MAKKAKEEVEEKEPQISTIGMDQLAQALVKAIEATNPRKKTAVNRKPGTPWHPKDGSPKLKLKRKHYQHGMILDQDMLSNEEVDLLNRLKVGIFMDGNVKVVRRRDKGIDIDYPVKTASQRLKLVNQYGVTSFSTLLQRCIDEASNPKTYIKPEDED